MKEYVVDLSDVTSWPDFIAAFNDGFIRHIGGEWNGNLDALNDYMYWPDEHPYHLVLRGWRACVPMVNQYKTWDGQAALEVIQEIFFATTHRRMWSLPSERMQQSMRAVLPPAGEIDARRPPNCYNDRVAIGGRSTARRV